MDYRVHCARRQAREGRQARADSSTCTAARSVTKPRLARSSRFRRMPRVGRRCKISSHTFICEGVTIEDHVFIGHGVMFINDSYPRATTATGELQTAGDWKVETHAREEGRVDRIRRDDPLERDHRRARHRRRRQRRDARRPAGHHRRRQSRTSACARSATQQEAPMSTGALPPPTPMTSVRSQTEAIRTSAKRQVRSASA